FGIFAKDWSREAVVHVAQRDDTLSRASLNITTPHTAHAHTGDAQGIARRLVAGAAQDVAWDHQRRHARCRSRSPGESASGGLFDVSRIHNVLLRSTQLPPVIAAMGGNRYSEMPQVHGHPAASTDSPQLPGYSCWSAWDRPPRHSRERSRRYM